MRSSIFDVQSSPSFFSIRLFDLLLLFDFVLFYDKGEAETESFKYGFGSRFTIHNSKVLMIATVNMIKKR